MDKFQCLGFEPTPEEKHVGIITVRIYGSIVMVVRFKIVAKKDGSGHFPTVASYKMPNRVSGEEYDEAFMLDSRSDHDQLIKFVMHEFHKWQKQQQPSVFNTYPDGTPVAKHQAQPSVPFVQRPEYQPEFAGMPPEMPPFDESKVPF